MTTAEPPARPPTRRPVRVARPKRGSETAMDMVRSLGLIAVIVAVTLVFVPDLLHPGKKDKFQAIDYSNYLQGFHSLTGKVPVQPMPLPAGWSANSADLSGPSTAEHLRIGFVTPNQEYVGLLESVGTPSITIPTLLGDSAAKVDGEVTINGASWDRRTSSRGEEALTRRLNNLTVIVTGSGSPEQLQAFAATLA